MREINLVTSDTGPEKRHNKRVLMRALFPVDSAVKFKSARFNRQSSGVLHSLSDHGAFVRGAGAPSVGEELEIFFRFGERHVRCYAKVIYAIRHKDGLTTPGFGVKFTRILASDFRAIHSMIEEFDGDLEDRSTEIRMSF